MLTMLTQLVFLVAALLAILAYYAPSLRREAPAERHAAWISLAMRATYAAALALLVSGFLLAGRVTLLNAFGVPLLVLGILLHTRAVNELGKHWSPHVAIQPRHVLVTTGLYGVVRHPIYLAAFLFYAGLAVWMASPLSVFALALVAAYLLVRIRVEERALKQKFGKTYDAYAVRVPALVPCFWV